MSPRRPRARTARPRAVHSSERGRAAAALPATVLLAIALPTMTLAACLGAPPASYPDPLAADGGGSGGGGDQPWVKLVTPGPYAELDTPTPLIQVSAGAPGGVVAVHARVGDGPWDALTQAADGWSGAVSLFAGANDVSLRATAGDGRTARLDTQLAYAGTAPQLRLMAPAGGGWAGAKVVAAGRAQAAAPAALATVELAVDDGAWVAASLDEDTGAFTGSVGANPQGDEGGDILTLHVRVTDSTGAQTTVDRRLVRDRAAPVVEVATPQDGAVTDDEILSVRATAHDAQELALVEVQVGAAGWVVAAPQPEAADAFGIEVLLDPGPNVIQVRAVDEGGNASTAKARVYRTRPIVLRPPPSDGGLVTLNLDRAGLEALVPPAQRDDLLMLYLDVKGLLLQALQSMRDYETYGVDTSAWGTAEWNMHGILTMTPDTADVTGTSLEPILGLAANLGIPVPQILADIADIAPTDTFVSPSQMADGLFEDVLSTHPALKEDPADGVKKIPVTLGDALADLTTLGDKLGPTADHPGILFDSTPAVVLEPGFRMTVTAQSNLVQHDGVDLSRGKSYLFVHTAGTPLMDFDFLDPARFQVTGIADEPEVDLAFLIREDPSFLPAGHDQLANPTGDGFYKGSSPVWGVEPWRFERVVADLMFAAYHAKYAAQGYHRVMSYSVGALTDAAVIDWDRGWLNVTTVGGVGDPPPPHYFWDAVTELAQVRLHDGGLAEGEADLHLRINHVRVPLTAAQVVEATRPVLEAEKDELAATMLGDHSLYASDCDLYLAQGAGGALYLYYVAPEDTPGASFTHAKPGLFRDAGLTDQAASTADQGSGDSVHAKVPVGAEEATYYAQDVDGGVWTLRVAPFDGEAVVVRLAPADDRWLGQEAP